MDVEGYFSYVLSPKVSDINKLVLYIQMAKRNFCDDLEKTKTPVNTQYSIDILECMDKVLKHEFASIFQAKAYILSVVNKIKFITRIPKIIDWEFVMRVKQDAVEIANSKELYKQYTVNDTEKQLENNMLYRLLNNMKTDINCQYEKALLKQGDLIDISPEIDVIVKRNLTTMKEHMDKINNMIETLKAAIISFPEANQDKIYMTINHINRAANLFIQASTVLENAVHVYVSDYMTKPVNEPETKDTVDNA